MTNPIGNFSGNLITSSAGIEWFKKYFNTSIQGTFNKVERLESLQVEAYIIHGVDISYPGSNSINVEYAGYSMYLHLNKISIPMMFTSLDMYSSTSVVMLTPGKAYQVLLENHALTTQEQVVRWYENYIHQHGEDIELNKLEVTLECLHPKQA